MNKQLYVIELPRLVDTAQLRVRFLIYAGHHPLKADDAWINFSSYGIGTWQNWFEKSLCQHYCSNCCYFRSSLHEHYSITQYIRSPQAGDMAWKNLKQKGDKMNPKWACYSGPFLQGGSGTESIFLIVRSCSGRQVGFDCRKYKLQSINQYTDMWTSNCMSSNCHG